MTMQPCPNCGNGRNKGDPGPRIVQIKAAGKNTLYVGYCDKCRAVGPTGVNFQQAEIEWNSPRNLAGVDWSELDNEQY